MLKRLRLPMPRWRVSTVLEIAAICGLLFAFAVQRLRAEPETIPPRPSPAAFTPYVGQTVADGANLPPPTLVGIVPLGPMAVGANFAKWDFTVNGQILGPGNYEIHVEKATDSDLPSGAYPPDPYLLVIGTDGSVQANLIIHDPQTYVVNLDGTLTPVPH